ncbi:MAG: hypothetical protein LBV50_10535 [Novosphingobium sp.]|jgi:hypothetical protein|nr:hypothetical protein [Novosphingobium sp.]
MRFLSILIMLLAGSAPAFARPVPVNPAISPRDPLPRRVFDCGGSTITRITDRGGRRLGDPSLGSNVTFANGGFLVGYRTADAVAGSRVGDHVLICLVMIPDPDGCPPGDRRGRRYTVTNLRTLQSWTEPDSNHSCGGA